MNQFKKYLKLKYNHSINQPAYACGVAAHAGHVALVCGGTNLLRTQIDACNYLITSAQYQWRAEAAALDALRRVSE